LKSFLEEPSQFSNLRFSVIKIYPFGYKKASNQNSGQEKFFQTQGSISSWPRIKLDRQVSVWQRGNRWHVRILLGNLQAFYLRSRNGALTEIVGSSEIKCEFFLWPQLFQMGKTHNFYSDPKYSLGESENIPTNQGSSLIRPPPSRSTRLFFGAEPPLSLRSVYCCFVIPLATRNMVDTLPSCEANIPLYSTVA